jgi:hypothetical protein
VIWQEHNKHRKKLHELEQRWKKSIDSTERWTELGERLVPRRMNFGKFNSLEMHSLNCKTVEQRQRHKHQNGLKGSTMHLMKERQQSRLLHTPQIKQLMIPYGHKSTRCMKPKPRERQRNKMPEKSKSKENSLRQLRDRNWSLFSESLS